MGDKCRKRLERLLMSGADARKPEHILAMFETIKGRPATRQEIGLRSVGDAGIDAGHGAGAHSLRLSRHARIRANSPRRIGLSCFSFGSTGGCQPGGFSVTDSLGS